VLGNGVNLNDCQPVYRPGFMKPRVVPQDKMEYYCELIAASWLRLALVFLFCVELCSLGDLSHF
jgi:hypothetical protein